MNTNFLPSGESCGPSLRPFVDVTMIECCAPLSYNQPFAPIRNLVPSQKFLPEIRRHLPVQTPSASHPEKMPDPNRDPAPAARSMAVAKNLPPTKEKSASRLSPSLQKTQ